MKVMSKSVEYEVIEVNEEPEFYIEIGKKLNKNYYFFEKEEKAYKNQIRIKFCGAIIPIRELYMKYLIIKDKELITIVDENIFNEVFVQIKENLYND